MCVLVWRVCVCVCVCLRVSLSAHVRVRVCAQVCLRVRVLVYVVSNSPLLQPPDEGVCGVVLQKVQQHHKGLVGGPQGVAGHALDAVGHALVTAERSTQRRQRRELCYHAEQTEEMLLLWGRGEMTSWPALGSSGPLL